MNLFDGPGGHNVAHERFAKNNTSCTNHRYLFTYFLILHIFGVIEVINQICQKLPPNFMSKIADFK